jgi:hypothetical protein
MKRERRQDRLKAAYAAAHQRLTSILYRVDPEGMGRSVGAPDDEYSHVATRLMTGLKDAATVEDVRAAITAMYLDAADELIDQVLEVWHDFRAKTASANGVE